jgi:hypothetical protein
LNIGGHGLGHDGSESGAQGLIDLDMNFGPFAGEVSGEGGNWNKKARLPLYLLNSMLSKM